MKGDKQYEGLRKKGMSKSRAGNRAQKQAAGRKGAKKSNRLIRVPGWTGPGSGEPGAAGGFIRRALG